MASFKSSIGSFLLRLSISMIMIVGGIWGLQNGGDAAVSYLRHINRYLGYAFAIVELLAGVFFFLELFFGKRLGLFNSVLSWIIIIVFAVLIILGDFLGGAGLIHSGFSLSWLYETAIHIVFLSSVLYLNSI